MFLLVAMNIYGNQTLTRCSFNQIKSENNETLYLLSALKKSVHFDYKKASSAMEQAFYQHSADIFAKNIFNPFHGTGLFLHSLK